jgi:hypothetical protein
MGIGRFLGGEKGHVRARLKLSKESFDRPRCFSAEAKLALQLRRAAATRTERVQRFSGARFRITNFKSLCPCETVTHWNAEWVIDMERVKVIWQCYLYTI